MPPGKRKAGKAGAGASGPQKRRVRKPKQPPAAAAFVRPRRTGPLDATIPAVPAPGDAHAAACLAPGGKPLKFVLTGVFPAVDGGGNHGVEKIQPTPVMRVAAMRNNPSIDLTSLVSTKGYQEWRRSFERKNGALDLADPDLRRVNVERLIQSFGGKVTNAGVSKQTRVLLVGESPSEKAISAAREKAGCVLMEIHDLCKALHENKVAEAIAHFKANPWREDDGVYDGGAGEQVLSIVVAHGLACFKALGQAALVSKAIHRAVATDLEAWRGTARIMAKRDARLSKGDLKQQLLLTDGDLKPGKWVDEVDFTAVPCGKKYFGHQNYAHMYDCATLMAIASAKLQKQNSKKKKKGTGGALPADTYDRHLFPDVKRALAVKKRQEKAKKKQEASGGSGKKYKKASRYPHWVFGGYGDDYGY